jgi:hypothetical protein
MNAAIDDVDLGIRRGAVLSIAVDLQSVRPFRCFHRVASGLITRRTSEQFEFAIFASPVVSRPATAYGDRAPSEVGRGVRPVASARASDDSARPSRADFLCQAAHGPCRQSVESGAAKWMK